MIIDKIVEVLLGIVRALLALIPDYTPPTATMNTSGASVANFAAKADGPIPIYTFMQVLAAGLAFAVVLSGVKASIWIYHQFWGSS